MNVPNPLRVPVAVHHDGYTHVYINLHDAFRAALADPECRAWLDELVWVKYANDPHVRVRLSDAIEARLREDHVSLFTGEYKDPV